MFEPAAAPAEPSPDTTTEVSKGNGASAPKDKGLSSKDFLNLGFSALALLISVGTAYWNTVRVVDDLRIRGTWQASIETDPHLKAVRIRPLGQATLFNLGTRAVAIEDVTMLITRSVRHDRTTQCEDENGTLYTRLIEPLVLKAGEVELLSFVNDQNGYLVDLDKADPSQGLDICYRIELSTGTSLELVGLRHTHFAIDASGRWQDTGILSLDPQRVFYRTSSIFSY